MVEELLETLVRVVDTQLLERVVLKFNTISIVISIAYGTAPVCTYLN